MRSVLGTLKRLGGGRHWEPHSCPSKWLDPLLPTNHCDPAPRLKTQATRALALAGERTSPAWPLAMAQLAQAQPSWAQSVDGACYLAEALRAGARARFDNSVLLAKVGLGAHHTRGWMGGAGAHARDWEERRL